MITFFTSLKPFRGTTAIQQKNALRSWRAVDPDCEILVFGAADGSETLFTEVGATVCLDVTCNDLGTPLISAMFSKAAAHAKHDVLCYINGDIILLSNFTCAVRRLLTWPNFAAVGQRWDLDWEDPVNTEVSGWETRLEEEIKRRGRRHDPAAMDFFVFRRGAVGPLPPFAIGRPAWDNFLIRHFLDRCVPLVDLSMVATPIHQNHDYGHIRGQRGRQWEGGEADHNRRLARASDPGFNPAYYTIRNAQWLATPRRIVPALTPARLWWRLMARVPSRPRTALRALFSKPGPILARIFGWSWKKISTQKRVDDAQG